MEEINKIMLNILLEQSLKRGFTIGAVSVAMGTTVGLLAWHLYVTKKKEK